MIKKLQPTEHRKSEIEHRKATNDQRPTTNEKKLLILTDWFHPGYKAGGPIRSIVNMVKLLAGEYKIYVLTSDRDHGDKQSYKGINTDQWLDYEGIAKVKYLSLEKQNYKSIKENIGDIHPDILYLNSMFSKVFSIFPIFAYKRISQNTRVVLAPRGMLQAGALQFKSFKKKLFLYLLRLTGRIKDIDFHATDAQEKVDIIKHLNVDETQVHVLGNIPGMSLTVKEVKKIKDELRLIFISRIVPKKNLLYVLDILKSISTHQAIYFTICGGVEDEKYWLKCKEIIDSYPKNIKVDFKGALVHEEIIPLLEIHHAFILSSYGENFGHAIFEALSAGRPVIISDQTPWRDLEARKAGWDIQLGQPEKFREAIELMASMDQETYEEWSKGAQGVADEYIVIANLKEKYMELFC